MNKPTFCISLDTELIWGRVHLDNYIDFIPRAKKEHVIIPQILKLFNKYKIPATWAITGHMMVDKCDGKHAKIVRPKYSWLSRDWFEVDRGGDSDKISAWVGKNLFLKILTDPTQEIASHSFSHFFWGEAGVSKKCVESDLGEWVRVAKKNRIKATSFVYPKNSIGYKQVLLDYGFTTYRGQDVNWYKALPSKLHSFLQLVDFLLPIPPSTVRPSMDSGLVNIPGSFYFISARGIRKFIPRGHRAFKGKLGIDAAIQNNEVFHLWTHPTDFADQTEKLLSDLEDILAYAAKMRKLGKLQIMTMREISKDYLAAT